MGVIAAGELTPRGALRRCAEDLLGAGAILSRLRRDDLSPDARFAMATADLERGSVLALKECESARELIARGFEDDVALAFRMDVSTSVPVMIEGSYVALTEGVDV